MTEKSKLTTLLEAHSIYRGELLASQLEIRQLRSSLAEAERSMAFTRKALIETVRQIHPLLDADLSGVLGESAAKALGAEPSAEAAR